MNNIIKILLLVLPLSAIASDGGEDIRQWWNGEYKQNIQPAQIAEQEKRLDSRCPTKIKYYEQLSADYPDDEFYKWRLKMWNNRCN